jgi:hypothetical protein
MERLNIQSIYEKMTSGNNKYTIKQTEKSKKALPEVIPSIQTRQDQLPPGLSVWHRPLEGHSHCG